MSRAPAAALPQIIDRWAAAEPDRVAVRFLAQGEAETARLTYGELAARARALAGALATLTRPGDRVVLAFPAGLDFAVAYLACQWSGTVAVPIEPRARHGGADTLVNMARDSGASLLLTDTATRPRLPDLGAPWLSIEALIERGGDEPVCVAPDPSAIAHLQYTSGSTAAPRAVAISHRALGEQLEAYRLRAGTDWRNLVFVSWLPHTHDFGLVGFMLAALFMGTPLVLMPPSAFLRRPMRWLEAITAYGGSYCGAPNFAYDLCAREVATARNLDLSAWRIASLGGDHISAATLDRFSAAFAPVGFDPTAWLPAYGLAESVLCATGRAGARVERFAAEGLKAGWAVRVPSGRSAVRLVSCGAPMPGQTVKIVDPDTRTDQPDGALGEIWLSGTSLADGYWNDAATTEALFDARVGDDPTPHLRTGDLGFVCDGELFVTGRIKDTLIVHGENHTPDAIEHTVQSVDARLLRGGGAVIQTDLCSGARLVAVQELARTDRLDLAALVQAIAGAVAEHHGLLLDEIILIRPSALPRTRSGKVRRSAVRSTVEAGGPQAIHHWRRPLDAETPVGPAHPSIRRALKTILENGEAAPVAISQGEGVVRPVTVRIEAAAQASPGADAVGSQAGALSYGALQALTHSAAALVEAQAPAGAAAALLADRSPLALAGLLGALRAGAPLLVLDPSRSDADLAAMAVRAGVAVLLHDRAHAVRAAHMQRQLGIAAADLDGLPKDAGPKGEATDPRPEAPAILVPSRGGAIEAISHADLAHQIAAKQSALGLGPGDRVAQTLGWALPGALWQVLAPLAAGGCVELLEDGAARDPRLLFDAAEAKGLTVVECAPTTLRSVFDRLFEPGSEYRLRALRWLVCRGEPLPADICRRWIGALPKTRVLSAWGVEGAGGDLAHQIIEWPPVTGEFRTPIGRPRPGVAFHVCNPLGLPVPEGEAGELVVSRVGAAPLRTGERAVLRADGAFDHLGRLDAQIEIGGLRVEPREIEAAVLRDPAVRQVHVSALSDTGGHARLVAYVTFRSGLTSPVGALRAAARHSLPAALTPEQIVILPEMPVTASGQLDPARLPTPELQPWGPDLTPPATADERAMLQIWRSVLGGGPPFGVHADFFDLGGCSRDAAAVSAAAEAHFGSRVEITSLFRTPTVSGMAASFAAAAARSGSPS